jgi:S-adenosylmethionine:tRNA ribosyltransferase-isomerase
MQRTYCLSDFDFALPPELIAQHPAAERSGSRLLDGCRSHPRDRLFAELPATFSPGDLLVFNDTRVIKARLFGAKDTGGQVEWLVERVLPGHEVLAQLRASKTPRPGSRLVVNGLDGDPAFEAEVLGRAGIDGSLFHLRFPSDPFALLEAHGHVPLPPYIQHADAPEDAQRYQTVFADRPGAVAAPTAALHFDGDLLDRLTAHGVAMARVTLHVGAGTFKPVRSENLAEHRMHSEWFDVPESTLQAVARTRRAGGRVVAVGTTTLRALESAALRPTASPADTTAQPAADTAAQPATNPAPGGTGVQGETDLFITPGFDFRMVDRLITNFHLPKSTLLMLVSAFAGYDQVRALYRHAIESRYRFFSYGDAMLLERTVVRDAQ